MSTDNSSKLKRSIWWPKSVTASKTLTGTDADIAFNNTNATGTITFTLPKASSGTTTTVNGLAFQFILTNTAGNSIVITPITGDTIRGYAASASLTLSAVGQLVELECITAGYWEIVSWGTNSSSPLTLTGPVTINAPTGGVAATLLIKAGPGSTSPNLNMWAPAANAGALIQGYNSTGATRTGYLDFISGTGGGGGATEVALDLDGSTANDWLSLVTGGLRRLQITGQGAVSINAPSAAVTTLAVAGASGTIALQVNANASGTASVAASFINGAASENWTVSIENPGAATGSNFGLLIEAGTNASDESLNILDKTGTVQQLLLRGNGTLFVRAGLGINGNNPPAQSTGFGTPVGNAVVANYNINDAGGANSNTNKCVAEILAIMKQIGFIGA